MAGELSDLGDDLADKVAQLGKPLAEFAVGGGRLVWQLLAAPLLFLGGLVFILGPVLAMGRVRGGAGLVKLIILGCVMLPAAVFLAMRAYRNWGLRVLVYPEGLVRLHRDRAHTVFWEEVETVWRKKYTSNLDKTLKGSLVYTVRRADGEELSFDDYLPDVERLGKLIRRETLKHQLPRALGEYEAGATLPFGKLAVNRAGVSNGTEFVPWGLVNEVKVDEDRIAISKKGRWLTWESVAVSDVPNPHVLQALMRHALAENRRSPDARPAEEEVT
jgi:hypothetical protein